MVHVPRSVRRRVPQNSNDENREWRAFQPQTQPSSLGTSDELDGKDCLFDPECEIFLEGGPDSKVKFDKCLKNPGHPEFIPVEDFRIEHLPVRFQSVEYMDIIRHWIDRTVKLTVMTISHDRPENYPGTPYSFPYSEFKAKKFFLSCGTGFISSLKTVESEDGPCPCSKCKKSKRPKREYVEITVCTAAHVVYDNTEALETKIECFYDSTNKNGVKCLLPIGATSSAFLDTSVLTCTTHDQDLLERLSALMSQSVPLSMGGNGWGVVISHPHGSSKQISVGKIQLAYRLKGRRDIVEWDDRPTFYFRYVKKSNHRQRVWRYGQLEGSAMYNKPVLENKHISRHASGMFIYKNCDCDVLVKPDHQILLLTRSGKRFLLIEKYTRDMTPAHKSESDSESDTDEESMKQIRGDHFSDCKSYEQPGFISLGTTDHGQSRAGLHFVSEKSENILQENGSDTEVDLLVPAESKLSIFGKNATYRKFPFPEPPRLVSDVENITVVKSPFPAVKKTIPHGHLFSNKKDNTKGIMSLLFSSHEHETKDSMSPFPSQDLFPGQDSTKDTILLLPSENPFASQNDIVKDIMSPLPSTNVFSRQKEIVKNTMPLLISDHLFTSQKDSKKDIMSPFPSLNPFSCQKDSAKDILPLLQLENPFSSQKDSTKDTVPLLQSENPLSCQKDSAKDIVPLLPPENPLSCQNDSAKDTVPLLQLENQLSSQKDSAKDTVSLLQLENPLSCQKDSAKDLVPLLPPENLFSCQKDSAKDILPLLPPENPLSCQKDSVKDLVPLLPSQNPLSCQKDSAKDILPLLPPENLFSKDTVPLLPPETSLSSQKDSAKDILPLLQLENPFSCQKDSAKDLVPLLPSENPLSCQKDSAKDLVPLLQSENLFSCQKDKAKDIVPLLPPENPLSCQTDNAKDILPLLPPENLFSKDTVPLLPPEKPLSIQKNSTKDILPLLPPENLFSKDTVPLLPPEKPLSSQKDSAKDILPLLQLENPFSCQKDSAKDLMPLLPSENPLSCQKDSAKDIVPLLQLENPFFCQKDSAKEIMSPFPSVDLFFRQKDNTKDTESQPSELKAAETPFINSRPPVLNKFADFADRSRLRQALEQKVADGKRTEKGNVESMNLVAEYCHGCPPPAQQEEDDDLGEDNNIYYRLVYDICTCPGSSGAPVICFLTPVRRLPGCRRLVHSGGLSDGTSRSCYVERLPLSKYSQIKTMQRNREAWKAEEDGNGKKKRTGWLKELDKMRREMRRENRMDRNSEKKTELH